MIADPNIHYSWFFKETERGSRRGQARFSVFNGKRNGADD